jgi:LCP family protein required for cell wall assembly
MTPPDEDRPYRIYGAGGRRSAGARPDPSAPGPDRPYTTYRARPRGLRARLGGDDGIDGLREPERGQPRARRPITAGRVVKWIALAVVAWLGLSLVLFLISAQFAQDRIDAGASGGFPLTSASTVLVLGSDQRPKSSKEPGANSGPSRSDTIMLMRTGGGASARLSIPRDTVVNIPGHGENKINAAFAFGGPKLAARTVEDYLGIRINHVVEVNFTNFPKFIDSLGGVDVKTGCIRAEISGGARNGGQTIRLSPGTHHLDGKTALALSRIRHNACNPAESDLTRVRRQQEILSAVKDKLLSPGTFFRLPWVAWEAPRAIRSDMGGVTLLALAGGMGLGGTPPIRVLTPSGAVTLPDGGAGLTVSEAEKRAAVRRFLKG